MTHRESTRRVFAVGLTFAAFSALLLTTIAGADEQTPSGKVRELGSPIQVNDSGILLRIPRRGTTTGDALRAAGISWSDHDHLVPAGETPLPAVNHIFLFRARTITLRIGTEDPRTLSTLETTVEDILGETGVTLSPLDRTTPQRDMPVADGGRVTVTRIGEGTRTEEERIPPAVKRREDPTLPLGKEVVDDQGKPGRAEVSVRIQTENGKEIARTVLKRTVIEASRPRLVRRGTKVVVLGAETGRASWFANTPRTAAHRSLPFGTRLRIVRTDTGAATIVNVAGRGPFLPGRVVDLSRDAFRALAPLATGTIPVRVERLP